MTLTFQINYTCLVVQLEYIINRKNWYLCTHTCIWDSELLKAVHIQSMMKLILKNVAVWCEVLPQEQLQMFSNRYWDKRNQYFFSNTSMFYIVRSTRYRCMWQNNKDTKLGSYRFWWVWTKGKALGQHKQSKWIWDYLKRNSTKLKLQSKYDCQNKST